MEALNGYALFAGGRAVGYTYFVCEEHKGLIGDLYVLGAFGGTHLENRLLSATLAAMMDVPSVTRIESQLMLMRAPFRSDLPYAGHLCVFGRNYMLAQLAGTRNLPVGKAAARLHVEGWSEHRHEDAARVIAAAYEGHVDSDINDQYRSLSGARRFLVNIIQYPGCGQFFQPASLLAFDKQSGKLAGMCLASLVAPDVGHITQVCVSPALRGTGVGYELIRRSLLALADSGCRRASLTVTSTNAKAVQLYERLGFQTRRKFAAHVWQGF
jgi:ribosomal protein S18 acetylase RimI-like enzyme